MQLHATDQKMGRFKKKYGWILVVASYLTLSHLSFLKEDEAINSLTKRRVNVEGIEGVNKIVCMQNIQGDLELRVNCRIS